MGIDTDIKALWDIDIDWIQPLGIDNKMYYGHREDYKCYHETEKFWTEVHKQAIFAINALFSISKIIHVESYAL